MGWPKGVSGNPKGKPKGQVGGRELFMRTLDRIGEIYKNRKNLQTALQKLFDGKKLNKGDTSRLAFFEKLVIPTRPKDPQRIEMSGGLADTSAITATLITMGMATMPQEPVSESDPPKIAPQPQNELPGAVPCVPEASAEPGS